MDNTDILMKVSDNKIKILNKIQLFNTMLDMTCNS
jgi:hypothetical protein